MKIETQGVTGTNKIARRLFLRYAGAGVASAGVLATAACHKDHRIGPQRVDLGTGDLSILNYAYALEQLEAAFYTRVILTPYGGISSTELAYLTSIRDHEVLHRNFFKATLGSGAMIDLTFDFSSIDFSSRTSVLGAAKTFEDLGIMAYNGSAYFIKNPDYLTLLSKIVSVEARHAALIRDLIAPQSFIGSDIVASNGLNNTMTIAQVLPIVNNYLTIKLNASNYNYGDY